MYFKIAYLYIFAYLLISAQGQNVSYCTNYLEQLDTDDCYSLEQEFICAMPTQGVYYYNGCDACKDEQNYGFVPGICNQKYYCEESSNVESCEETEVFQGVTGCYIDQNGQEQCIQGINPCQICYETEYLIEYYFFGNYEPTIIDIELPSFPENMIDCDVDENGYFFADFECDENSEQVCAYNQPGVSVEFPNACEACLYQFFSGYTYGPCEHEEETTEPEILEQEQPELPEGFFQCEHEYDNAGNFVYQDCPEVEEELVCVTNGYYFMEANSICSGCNNRGIVGYILDNCQEVLNYNDDINQNPTEVETEQQTYNDGFKRCPYITDVNEQPGICTFDYVPVCGQSNDGKSHQTYGNSCQACLDFENVIGYYPGECQNDENKSKRIYCPINNTEEKDCSSVKENDGKGITGCYLNDNGREICNIKADNYCDLCYGDSQAEYYYIKGSNSQLLVFAFISMIIFNMLLI